MNDKSNILSGLMPRQMIKGGNNINYANDKENAHNNRLIGGPPPTSGARSSGRAALSLTGQVPTGTSTGKQHKLKQRFNVIRKLGKGTYGKVQLAINKKTGQEVAIKTIKKTKIETEQDLQRVRREIQIMSSIEHPHIIHIYEVFENKDKIVLVMQYAPGGELFEYVSECKILDDNEARRLFRQIATAIYYCHQNKICHRDLKLENILLDEKNNAKLADFGLSNVFDKRRQLSTFCGSPLYASPEIVQGSPYEGPEVDCWSLGVLLYTLVYGAMPFDGSNFKRLVKQISEASYLEPKQKSLASPLIRRLLCADPTCRATILDICADPWVNNLLQPSSPLRQVFEPSSPAAAEAPAQHQQQAHNSLLKVAQDMANLTPVRFDILLALVESSPPASDNRAPLAKIPSDRANESDRAQTNSSRQHGDPTERALEPTKIMEVDEAREPSPVASYVVRDLDVEQPQTPPDIEAPSKIEEDTAQLSVTASQQPEQFTSEVLSSERADEESSQQPDDMQATEQAAEEAQVADLEGEQVTDSTDTQDQVRGSDMEIEAKKEEEEEEEEEEVGMEIDPSQSQEQVLEQQTPPDEAEDAEPSKVVDETEMAKNDDGAESKETALGGAETTAAATEAAAAEKPKKKKKIIVVKKRKKVVKKDQESEKEASLSEQGKDKRNSASEASRKGSSDEQQVGAEQQQPPRRLKAGPKAPGKIRIPNTFQATNDNKDPSPSVRTGAEGRRPSALVVDVSQKLLQQQQPQQPPQSTSPPPVASIRVADKKSEFERRASLAATQVQVQLAKAGLQHQQLELTEPERVEHQLLREVLNMMGQIEQTTIVEPVKKSEPLEVAEAINLAKAGELPASESQTPTGAGGGAQSEEDIQRRLAEWTGKLNEARRESGQQRASLDSGARDDRSDSAETIKADPFSSPSDTPSNVRSSLQVNLSGGGELGASGGPRDLANTAGPAPITRSYKKVTFTKDGACVTETGKIYATQCDDGTVRRVERKSKITHYPAGDSSASSGGSASVNESKLIVLGGSGAGGKLGERSFWQSNFQGDSRAPQLRPFEKLIMPSSGAGSMLAAQLTDEEEVIDEADVFGGEFARRRSLLSRGRADSDASSCSSGSTDVFDDIFDTWTGAISMFNQNRHQNLLRRLGSGSLMDPANEPSFATDFRSLFNRRSGRPVSVQGGAGSVAGTPPRCGSVEPSRQRGARHRRDRDRDRWPRETSGYESDAPVPLDRPASALPDGGGWLDRARKGFESGSRVEESLFAGDDDLLRNLEQEHASLRQRLAERHRQLWKGSTPSLHNNMADSSGGSSRHLLLERAQPDLWHFLEPDFGGPKAQGEQSHRARSSSSSQSGRVQQQHQQPAWPRHYEGAKTVSERQQVEQSQSSSSFLRQSIALDASPIRKNTATRIPADHQLPPRQTQAPMRRSVSKTSVTTTSSQQQQVKPDGKQMTSEKHSACFIELKRTSSSSVQHSQADEPLKQKLESQVTSSSAKLISSSAKSGATSHSSTSLALGAACKVPGSLSTVSALEQVSSSTDGVQRESSKQMESRIQDWLQESESADLSASNSRSSVSTSNEAPQSGGKKSSLYLSLVRPHKEDTLSKLADGAGSLIQSSDSKQQLVKHSTSSTIVVASSSSRHSTSGSEQGRASRCVEQRTQQVFTETRDSGLDTLLGEHTLSTTSSSTRVPSRTTSTLIELDDTISNTSRLVPSTVLEEEDDSVLLSAQQHRAISQSSSFSARVSPTLNSPNIIKDVLGNSAQIKWATSVKQQEQHESIGRFAFPSGGQLLFSGEDADSQSGAGSAELESHSSSSLLDQLKSRGYRSMINQRNQQQVSSTTQAAASSFSVVESSSRSVVTSSSISEATSKVMQQKPQDLLNNEPDNSQDSTNLSGNCSVPLQTNESKQEAPNATVEDNSIATNSPGEKASGGETGEQTTEPEQEEEEEDEDVREAKANIKGYLDSVKETEMFLKSLQKEEENLERKRQQLYLFDNLMLSSKLNGIRAGSEVRSAPIRSGYMTNNELAFNSASIMADEAVNRNGYTPSEALSFEPTYTVSAMSAYSPTSVPMRRATNAIDDNDNIFSDSFYQRPSVIGYSVATDPLEPVQPLTVSHDLIGSTLNKRVERRSRSQLSDQFSDYKYRRTQVRPLSANIQDISDENVYFPSRTKRSLSQLRYSSLQTGARYSGGDSQPMMSEYMSAYGRASAEPARQRQVSHSEALTSNGLETSVTGNIDTLGDDSDDCGMAAYRASAYVPRVVPQGMPTRGKAAYTARRERRTSLQPQTRESSSRPLLSVSKDANDTDDKDDQVASRRRSMTDVGAAEALAPSSRLSELEQRIQANKRRREDLLAGKLSPEPASNRRSGQLDESMAKTSADLGRLSRDSSPQARGAQQQVAGAGRTGGKLARPSRLESMEARIKRKSYCVRVGDCSPERSPLFGQVARGAGQTVSLEKWRSQAVAASSSARSPLSSPRHSIATGYLFACDSKRTLPGESGTSAASEQDERQSGRGLEKGE